MKTLQKATLLLGFALLAIVAMPSVLGYGGYGGSGNGPGYGSTWGILSSYPYAYNNYISPPQYISFRGGDNCLIGVRSAYWGGFQGCQGYGASAVRPWGGTSPYTGINYQGPARGYGQFINQPNYAGRGGYGGSWY